MSDALSIGDFSVITHLSIKTLRYYHQVGLLEPAEVDPHTGYRRYRVEQIPTAQIIQRFRDLDMPIDEVKAVLAAPDLDTRNALIAAHLSRLEGQLEQTRQTVLSLRNLLEPARAPISVEYRTVRATQAVGIQDVVDLSDLLVWYHGALGELYATIAVQGMQPSGPSGGLFASDLFQYERGEATVFVPVSRELQSVGRVCAAGGAQPLSWRSPRMVDHTPRLLPPTERLAPTFPRMRWPLLVPFGSTTSSMRAPPVMRPSGAPKSPGRFFRPGRTAAQRGA